MRDLPIRDLQSWLSQDEEALFRPRVELSVVEEISALVRVLAARQRFPVIVVERPVLAGGERSRIPVVTNVTASRELVAAAVGIEDHRQAGSALAARVRTPVPPEPVDSGETPVHEVVVESAKVDLAALPALCDRAGAGRQAITAGFVVTADPQTGACHCAPSRLEVLGARRLAWSCVTGAVHAEAVRAWWSRGEPCPVAVSVGHHPALALGLHFERPGAACPWGAAGAIAGGAVRLASSLTHGAPLTVPAEAEMVIEGSCRVGSAAIEVTCITRRRDPLYQDAGAGLAQAPVPRALATEAALHALVAPVAPSLIDVHVPLSGAGLHAYLRFRDPRRGEARDALATALACQGLRTVIAFDEDIDPFDVGEVAWAIATRMQWHRDAVRIDALSGPDLVDPPRTGGARPASRLGLDATLPPAPRRGAPKPFTPRIEVPVEARDRAEQVLAGASLDGFPAQ